MYEIDKEAIKKFLIKQAKFIRDRTIECISNRTSFDRSTSIIPNSDHYLRYIKRPLVNHEIPDLFGRMSFIDLTSWDIKVKDFNKICLVLNNKNGAAHKRYWTRKENMPDKNYNDVFMNYSKESNIQIVKDWVSKNTPNFIKWKD